MCVGRQGYELRFVTWLCTSIQIAMQMPRAFALYAGHLRSHTPAQISRNSDGDLLRKMMGTKVLAQHVADIMQGYIRGEARAWRAAAAAAAGARNVPAPGAAAQDARRQPG